MWQDPPSSKQTPSPAVPEPRAMQSLCRLVPPVPYPLGSGADAPWMQKALIRSQTSLCRKQPRIPQPGWGLGDREQDTPRPAALVPALPAWH